MDTAKIPRVLRLHQILSPLALAFCYSLLPHCLPQAHFYGWLRFLHQSVSKISSCSISVSLLKICTTVARRKLCPAERNSFPQFPTSVTGICRSVSLFRSPIQMSWSWGSVGRRKLRISYDHSQNMKVSVLWSISITADNKKSTVVWHHITFFWPSFSLL
jgi:hypothetical protein